jgi:hypothetical protein
MFLLLRRSRPAPDNQITMPADAGSSLADLFHFKGKELDIMNMIAGAATPAMAAKVAGALGLPRSCRAEGDDRGHPGHPRHAPQAGLHYRRNGRDQRGARRDGQEPPRRVSRARSGVARRRFRAAAQGGSDMLGSLLGVGAAGGLTKTLASYAGIDEKAAGPLMGILGSTALGGLKSAADQGRARSRRA